MFLDKSHAHQVSKIDPFFSQCSVHIILDLYASFGACIFLTHVTLENSIFLRLLYIINEGAVRNDACCFQIK